MEASSTIQAATETTSIVLRVIASNNASAVPWWGVPAVGVAGTVLGGVVAGVFALKSARLTSDAAAVERDRDRDAEVARMQIETDRSIRLANHESVVEAYRAIFGIVISVEQMVTREFHSQDNCLTREACTAFFARDGDSLIERIDESKTWMLHANADIRDRLIEYFDYVGQLPSMCAAGPVTYDDFVVPLTARAARLQGVMRVELGLESGASESTPTGSDPVGPGS